MFERLPPKNTSILRRDVYDFVVTTGQHYSWLYSIQILLNRGVLLRNLPGYSLRFSEGMRAFMRLRGPVILGYTYV
jgi:hypothetical protein